MLGMARPVSRVGEGLEGGCVVCRGCAWNSGGVTRRRRRFLLKLSLAINHSDPKTSGRVGGGCGCEKKYSLTHATLTHMLERKERPSRGSNPGPPHDCYHYTTWSFSWRNHQLQHHIHPYPPNLARTAFITIILSIFVNIARFFKIIILLNAR